jgi:excisionase family DNA binding protein
MSNSTKHVPEPLLTPAEVATMFRVDPKTVTRWAKAGKIGFIRTVGGHRRYRETEVRALLAGIPQDGGRTVTIEQITHELRAAFHLDTDARWAVVERVGKEPKAAPYSSKTRDADVLDHHAREHATQIGATFIALHAAGSAK